jgi:hypothetical protein
MAITVDSEVDLLLYPDGSAFSTAKSIQNDFGLNIKSITYGFPEPKTNYIPVPHSSLVYDYTNIYGATTFGMRTITAELMFMGDWPAWHTAVDALRDYINGVDMCIVDKSDADWFYQGRAKMEPTHDSYYMAPIKIEWKCLPFKMSVEQTVITVPSAGSIVLPGSPQPVHPVITSADGAVLNYYGRLIVLPAGTNGVVGNIVIESDDAPAQSTSGTATFTYRKASL